MNNLTAIILTFNEDVHIRRCIESIQPLADKIFIIDSYSTDDTVQMAESMGAVVVKRHFKNQAEQFQWGLDNLNITTKWVMKLDADEYLEQKSRDELQKLLFKAPDDVDGFYIRRKILFMRKWIRYGGVYPLTVLRIWRDGRGRVEQRWMDEHIILPPGAKTVTIKGNLVDDNLKGITFWTDKHNHYASREMADILIQKYFPGQGDHALREMKTDPQARWKRIIKEDIYGKMPIGFRAVLYFFYRYFLRFGFLDGGKGFTWHFMQGFWYRLLVDIKVNEIESRCGGDLNLIRKVILEEYGIRL